MKKRLVFFGLILVLLVLTGRAWLPLFVHSDGRSLTEGEVSMAQTVFHDSLDYDAIKIYEESYLPLQHVPLTPDGNVYYSPESLYPYLADFSKGSSDDKSIFIHELAHVWQHQHGVNVYLRGLWEHAHRLISRGRYNPYALPDVLDPNKNFFEYNIEQQGNIVAHYFDALNNSRGQNDKTPLSTYKAIIPFKSKL